MPQIGSICSRFRKNETNLVLMPSVQEKEVVMKNLNRLKNADEFRKLSIKDNYTRKEREEIKTWVAKAKDKNEQDEESTFIWRIRDCPKKRPSPTTNAEEVAVGIENRFAKLRKISVN